MEQVENSHMNHTKTNVNTTEPTKQRIRIRNAKKLKAQVQDSGYTNYCTIHLLGVSCDLCQ